MFKWRRCSPTFLPRGASNKYECATDATIHKTRVGTQQLLKSCHLSHAVEVCLCATAQKSKSGFPVGKKLRFVCTHERFAEVLHAKFGVCACSQHAPMNDVNFHETGKYKVPPGLQFSVQLIPWCRYFLV